MASFGDDSHGVKRFTKFPQLPAELRSQVWLFASFHRRRIPVAVKDLHRLEGPHIMQDKEHQLFRFRCDTPIPALFSVCKEARREAKKHFQKVMVAKHTFSFFSMTLIPRFYTNPVCDRICPIGDYDLPKQQALLASIKSSGIKSIALDESQWCDMLSPSWRTSSGLGLWVEGTTDVSNSIQSIWLYFSASTYTSHKPSPKSSVKGTPFIPDWDQINHYHQCAVTYMLSKFFRHLCYLRRWVQQVVDREANGINRGFGREKVTFATRVYKSEIDTATLKDWIEPRVQLIADNLPPHFTRFLLTKDSLASVFI
ncbi:4309731f-f8b6-489f-b173-f4663c51de3e-CDS [Sclerotinia trifoliorum]|uniref:4309731f-f8b6-489f-b173-f4663c51de3e-CDS n=1 Tax=Sclerotinia trifoliorum TaxID=28548 RepID=A0A8H2VQ82_9HELO|nr:4309731f-f8b6-489f-b173-f4663c51de3e-CDS [Sclerotinia trifoliorum]